MSERRFGILIASSRFPEEPKLEDLRCPEGDVDGLNEILTSKDHGEFTETLVLKNKPHHEVLRNINRVLREASKNDLVLIYYSGHGKLNPAGRLHLAAVDTVVNELESTSIPIDTLRNYVDISPSNKVVLILDCCFSGAAGAAFARSSVDDQLQLASGGRGTYIMTASTGIQVAQEKESDQYGVFTKHILGGIREGEADLDSNGRITMEELYRYVHDKVLDEGFQEPMKWDLNVRGELVIARSGKIPGEERRKQIREILFDLAKKGMIADDILDKAREVIAQDPTELSGELRAYDDLLEQLLQKRLEPVDFIRKWDKVGWKPSPQKGEPATPEPPPPGPAKPEPRPREPKTPEPRRMSRTLKFGALGGVAVLLLIFGWWLISQNLSTDIPDKIDRIDTQLSELKQTVAQAKTLEQLEGLVGELKGLTGELPDLEQMTKKVGMSSEFEELARRSDDLLREVEKRRLILEFMDTTDKQLSKLEQSIRGPERLEQAEAEELQKRIDKIKRDLEALKQTEAEVGMSSEFEELARRSDDLIPKLARLAAGRLFVDTVPRGARVRILNIGPEFHQGIELEPGDYHVEVSANGYEVEKRWIGLSAGEDKRIKVNLVRPDHAVEVRVTSQLVLEFKDTGSGAKMNLAVYRPVLPGPDWHWVGHCEKGRKTIIVKETVENSLKPPSDYKSVWADHGSGKKDSYSLWKIVPPRDYVALGYLFVHRGRNDYGKPRGDEIEGLRCVHKKLVTQGRVHELVWNDRGTGARKDGSVWRIEPIDNAKAWDAGTIYAQGSHAKPPEHARGVYCLLK